MSIVEFFIKKHMAVFTFCVLIVIVGGMAYMSLPRESMPEIKQPYIFITTTYPGVSAKDVESLVTRPIEEELDGLEGIDEISSTSQQSLSFIFIEFTPNTPMEVALRRVRQRVDIAKAELPDDADEPVVQELSSSEFPIFIVSLSHPDGLAVIDEASKMLEERFKRLEGVLDVTVSGRLEKEVAIEVDPNKLEHYGFSLNDVIWAIQSENTTIPGGLLKNPEKNYTLDVTGEITDPYLFEDIIISSEGKKIRVGEIATAKFTWAEPESFSRFNGNPSISISLTKRMGENIVYLSDDAMDVIEELKGEFPPGTIINIAYDESVFIRDTIKDLENNMFTGFLLVLFVTLFFLGRINAFFVSLAIPFSMLMSFFTLQLFGITLNMIVLFSLILSLGMLVDNGIVIVENIYRHSTLGKNRRLAAIDGSQEVAGPIIASTITTCLAFFPIVFMPGIMGDIMSYLPKTVIVVLASSLVVALTINPTFCASFLKVSPKSLKKIQEGSGKFVAFQTWYEKVLRWAVKHNYITIPAVIVLVITGITLYIIIGKEPVFFPEFDPETAFISIESPQGTPLEKTDELIQRIENIVPYIPASLKNYQTVVGQEGGYFSGGGYEYHKGYIRVEFKSYLEREIKGKDAIEDYREELKDFTGADLTIEAIDFGPPSGNDISYDIIGQDYAIMGNIAGEIINILKQYPELKIIDTDYEPARPEISVIILRDKAAFYGLSTMDIAQTIRNAINGSVIGKFRESENEYDIVVRYQEEYRDSLSHLLNLQVINRDGERIPVESVAIIKLDSSVGVIKRRNLKRAVAIWADFREDIQNKEEITEEIEEQIQTLMVNLPKDYSIQPGEGFEMRVESTDFLIQAFILAIFLIFVVLIAQFNSILESLIILISVFLSIGGVLWGYLFSGETFVIIMSGIGCIALAGVVVNNCIVLVDYTNVLIRRGTSWKEAIIEAGKTRLRPVLLTAITTVLGLMPMALGISIDFHWPDIGIQLASESAVFWRAFSLAMIFGLSFATIMTLVIVPSLLKIKFSLFPPKEDSFIKKLYKRFKSHAEKA
jgi:multidrug efflux pump